MIEISLQALVQLFTIFTWVAYAGAEWSMTRNMTEEERKVYIEEQELKLRHLNELDDFDSRLIGSGMHGKEDTDITLENDTHSHVK